MATKKSTTGPTLETALEVTQGHELAQHLGWVSEFLESVLPISESLLRTRGARVLLDAWSQAAIARDFEGVLDLALAVNEPHIRPSMVRFYSERLEPLANILRADELLQLDQRLRKKLENQIKGVGLIRAHAQTAGVDVDVLYGRFLGELGVPTLASGPLAVERSSDQLMVEPSENTLRMRDSGLIVERDVSDELMPWRNARAFAEVSSGGGRWRLPTPMELATLATTPGSGRRVGQRDYYWSCEAGIRAGEAVAVHIGRVERWLCPMNWPLRVWRVRSPNG